MSTAAGRRWMARVVQLPCVIVEETFGAQGTFTLPGGAFVIGLNN